MHSLLSLVVPGVAETIAPPFCRDGLLFPRRPFEGMRLNDLLLGQWKVFHFGCLSIIAVRVCVLCVCVCVCCVCVFVCSCVFFSSQKIVPHTRCAHGSPCVKFCEIRSSYTSNETNIDETVNNNK